MADLLAQRLVRVAALVSAVVVVLGGVASALLPHRSAAALLLHLDREHGLAAGWSALLVLAAAVAAWRARRTGTACTLTAGLLVLLAADEFLALHETFEDSTGVDWQVLYAPVALLAALLALVLVRALRTRHPRVLALLVLAGACWTTSQVLEAAQWDGDTKRHGYVVLMHAEEVLEMTGAVVLLGAFTSLRRSTAPAPAPDGRATTGSTALPR
ncbi:hypothetical protein GCM10027586_08920 [Kineococcus gypseus]